MGAGLLYAVGYCGLDQFYLCWVCLLPILWVIDDPRLSLREITALGLLFGTTACFGGYYWMVIVIHDMGGMPWPVAIAGTVGFAALQGSRYALWGLAVAWLARRGIPVVWTAPVTLVVIEWLYPGVFPLYLSSSQYEQTIFVQSADLWGPMGLSGIVALSSAVLYQTLAHFRRPRSALPIAGWAVFAILLGANLIYGAVAVARVDAEIRDAERTVRIATVQANVSVRDADRRIEAGHRRLFAQSLEVQEAGAELIVWPEGSYGYTIPSDRTDFGERVTRGLETPVLLGSLREVVATEPGDRDRFYNTAFLVDARGQLLGSYDKNRLIIYGEYIPFAQTFPGLEAIAPFGTLTPGEGTTPLRLDGVGYGIFICYEDLFPDFGRQVMARAPGILVNLTNDVWFGKTTEPSTHLAVATFRAVESRRFLVRATNTGTSAFVDHAGRIIERGPEWQTANLMHEVPVLTGQTIYTRFGDWLPAACLGLCLWWVLRSQPRSRAATGSSTAGMP